jgi:hypothetical protein
MIERKNIYRRDPERQAVKTDKKTTNSKTEMLALSEMIVLKSDEVVIENLKES